jgi:DNA repair protein RadC
MTLTSSKTAVASRAAATKVDSPCPRGDALPSCGCLRGLSDAQLLGQVLGYDAARAGGQGQALLQHVGSVAALGSLSDEALQRLPNLNRRRGQRWRLVMELHRRLLRPPEQAQRIRGVADVLSWARASLVHLEHEELWLLSLDAKNGLRAAERVAQGGIHGCAVTPRDVLRPAVRNGAAAVVVVHNHPSGDPTPSAEDITMTQALAQACMLLGIPLLDHVVVASGGACSAGPETGGVT